MKDMSRIVKGYMFEIVLVEC